jgi:hypothetical protein
MRQDKNKPSKTPSSAWMLMIVLHLSILLALLFFSVPARKVIPSRQQIETEIKADKIESPRPTA